MSLAPPLINATLFANRILSSREADVCEDCNGDWNGDWNLGRLRPIGNYFEHQNGQRLDPALQCLAQPKDAHAFYTTRPLLFS